MDVAGVAFAAFLMICAAVIAINLFRAWSSLQNERFFGTVLAVSTMLLGIVLIAHYTGRLENGPAYQTLDIALSALSAIMVLMVIVAARRRQISSGAADRAT